MSTPRLELESLLKEYDDGSIVAVDGIDLKVEAGETIALLGPSGCGKSTTLNMIVGLEEPTRGDIRIDGRSIVNVPPGKRNVGLVFQDYAVFTSMSVRQNLAFGLEVRGTPKAEIERAVAEVAELLGMSGRLDARVRDLGGSELQRVAIGRTLVTKPAILLLDEPLSNLEAEARLAMRRELRRLQREIGLTIIYVTHDQVEALSLADRIAVMNFGKIMQVEDTTRICERPEHVFVAGFLGSPPMNLIKGEVEARGDMLAFRQGGFFMPLDRVAVVGESVPSARYTLGIRPESVRLASKDEAAMTAQVLLVEFRGPDVILTLDLGPLQLKALAPASDHPGEGQEVGLDVPPGDLVLFGGDSNRRIDICFTGGAC